MRFRLFGSVVLIAISVSVSASVNADLFKDLKKALEDVESQLAPGLSQGNQSQGNGAIGSDNVVTSPTQKSSSSAAQSQAGSSKEKAFVERLCSPLTEASVYKKLSKPDFALIEKDFGKTRDDIEFGLKKYRPQSHPYLIDFEIYKSGFATDAISEIFSNFARRPNVEDLAVIAATAKFKGFDANKKKRALDAKFAYGLIHSFFVDAGGNEALGGDLIKDAAKSNQFAARYIEGLRWYKGYGRQINLTNAATWMLPAYEIAQGQDGDLPRIIEDTFLRLVVDPNYERRDLYLDLIAEAERQREALEQTLDRNAGSSSIASVYLPKLWELTQTRSEILIDLATLAQMGSDIERFKADYNMLINQSNPSVATVSELVVRTDEFEAFLQEQENSFAALEREGQQKLQGLYGRAENLVADARSVSISFKIGMVFGGGSFDDLLNRDALYIFQEGVNAPAVACDLHRTILAYGQRTNAQLQPKQVTFSENVLPTKKKKKKKR